MDKARRLAELQSAWTGCTRCPHLCEARTQMVFGYGNPNAQIMVLGEGPWALEDQYGLPFVGPAGQLLDNILAAVSVDSRLTGEDGEIVQSAVGRREVLLEEYYYCNLILCKPTGDKPRPPNTKEWEQCRDHLMQQIYIVDPVLIIGAGAAVLHRLTGRSENITSKAGEVVDVTVPGKIVPLLYSFLPILHPSYLLRKGTVHSPEFATTYNQLAKARQVLDLYNQENFGIDPPPNRPQPTALTPEEEEENQELEKKLKRRMLFTDRVMEATDGEDHQEDEGSSDREADGHAPRRRSDEPDDGEDWAEGDDGEA
jgi:uracil-DNA glycosylase